MDLRALEEPPPLDICLIDDIHVLSGWEYWLKLSYFTADLHVVRAWRLNSRATEAQFESQARALRGPIVYSFLDADRMPGPQTLDEALRARRFGCDWEKQIFPTGALEAPACFSACPTGTFKVLLCKLATGSTLAHQESEGNFETRHIPGAYASLALIESSPATNETKMLRMIYRVKKASQVLPSMVLEFSFQCLLIDVTQPLCEVCELLPATLFCPADRAHLCDECDDLHHSATKLLARHKRLPVTHSPFQFGQCPNHPSEMIDCVCMVCFVALCPHCILIGHHSAADFSEHPLISTLDAYKMSMQGTSPSEEALSLRREKILKDLQGNHRLLSRLHANFASVHRRIDDSNKALMTQLQNIKYRQVGFLQALKRELLTEYLVIEWMEAFFAHLRLALCPSDYLSYQHKHDLLAADLFGGTVRVEVNLEFLPPWITEKLFIEGEFRVITTAFSVPELQASEVEDDNLLRVFLKGMDKTRKNKLKITDGGTPHSASSGSHQDGDSDDGISDDDSEVAIAELAMLRGAADEAAPKARVHALSRVLLFPDEPATKGLPSQKQQEALEQEGENCMRAEVDKEQLPPQIRRALRKAEAEGTEGRVPGSGLDDPLNRIPNELVKQLWTIASDLNFHPLFLVLKAAERQQLPELLRSVCAVAAYMKDVEGFLKKLLEFELGWVGSLPESLFLGASSLCGPLFDGLILYSRLLLKKEDRQWLFTLLGPPLRAVSQGLASHSEDSAEHLGAPEEVVYPPLKALIDNLTNMEFIHIPSSIRGLLYLLTDCIDSEGDKIVRRGLPLVPGGPPNPTNFVSAAAVSTCAQLILSRFLASSLHLLREEVLTEAIRPKGKPMKYILEVPPSEAGKTAAEVAEAHVDRLFWDRRSLPPISALDKALRHLGSFCSEAAVSALLLEENKTRKTKEEAEIEKVLAEIKQRLATHPDHRFFTLLAVRVTTWMRRQLELPRLHSPIVFCSKEQPQLGEEGAKNLLTFISQLDARLKDGTFRSKEGLVPEDIYSPHFERLVELATTASAYTLPKTSAL